MVDSESKMSYHGLRTWIWVALNDMFCSGRDSVRFYNCGKETRYSPNPPVRIAGGGSAERAPPRMSGVVFTQRDWNVAVRRLTAARSTTFFMFLPRILLTSVIPFEVVFVKDGRVCLDCFDVGCLLEVYFFTG